MRKTEGERIAVLQVEQQQEAVSRRQIAKIAVRHAERLVAGADILPLAAFRALPPPETASKAASTIGRFWRRYKQFDTYSLLQKFHEQGPTIERVRSIRYPLFWKRAGRCAQQPDPDAGDSFDDLIVFLRNKEVIAVGKACLQRVHLSSTFRHRTLTRALAPDSVNVRVFLAGYMIAYCPTHVFESMGPLENALLEAAVPMLESFQTIIDAVRNSPQRNFSSAPPELTRDFPEQLFEYLRRFKVVFSLAGLVCSLQV